MSQTAQAQHISEIIARTSTLQNSSAQTDMISRSWMRCIDEHGLDPVRTQPARIIEHGRLREHQEQVEDFLRVARSGMEQLYKRVSPLGYVLLLTDSQGVTVDFIGNDQWSRELKRSGLCLGSDWRESHAGTCAVGTCIVEQAPVICHQTDHFDATHISLTCTAAPLWDPKGNFLGVLDISALQSPSDKSSQHLTGHVTQMYARMIEDANFIRHFGDKWILRLGADWALVDMSGNCMIAFDADGLIVGANSIARRTLSAMCADGSVGGIVGRHLKDVFRGSMDNIWRVASSVTTNEHGILTTHRDQVLFAVARPPRRTASSSQTNGRNTQTPAATKSCPALDCLAGDDAQMQRLIDQAKRLVDKKVNILLHGETGTGKEVVARALHDSSNRADQPFVAVNCASIPESLIESELFGYTAGSFTGGRSKGARGLILQADGGTLFLDEIGDMPLHLQTRLLRVLSEQEVMPVGALKPIPVNLTVVAASHRDLRLLMVDGVFREDLYYRLCGAALRLPALRHRTDKTFIINRLLRQEADKMGVSGRISNEALHQLLNFSWPGNIRQLRNVIRFSLAVSEEGQIEACHLPEELLATQTLLPRGPQQALQHEASSPLRPEAPAMSGNVQQSEQAASLLEALRRHHWNITAVSQDLGICRATVYRQMKRFDIVSPTQML